ncbi:hypothetical protein ACFLRU_06035 [Bacteroidota bacterium]
MKIYIQLLIVLTILSCGGGDSSEENSNGAPEIVNLTYPTNNLLCITNNIKFEWTSAIDLEGDDVRYKIEISSDNEFTNIVKSGTFTQTEKTYELEQGKAYYWHIKSSDNHGNSNGFGATNNFYTENLASENHLPFMPELIAPAKNTFLSTNQTNLEWSCSDTDNDVLTYDVYFGTTQNPGKIASVNETTIEVTLNANKTYYWKIDAIDAHNSKTLGQIWSFKTE